MLKSEKKPLVAAVNYIIPLLFISSIPELYFGWHWISTIIKASTVLISLIIFFLYEKSIHSPFKTIAVLFIAYNLFTGIAYLYNDRPFACYLASVSDYILPMFFIFIGMLNTSKPRAYYDNMVYVVVVVFALGTVCYALTPGWYLSRMVEATNAHSDVMYDEVNILDNLRFRCFFTDSYPISHYSMFCLSIALFNYYRQDNDNKWLLIFVIISLLTAIISLHRVAIAFALLITSFYVVFSFFKGKKGKNKIVITILLAGILAVPAFNPDMFERVGDITESVTKRTDSENMSVSGALKERKFTTELLKSMDYYIIGHGSGSGGAEARRQGFIGVTDMNYIVIFYETGILGALFFIYIILITILRGLKYYRYYLTELGIIFFILIAMLGSNSLMIYYLYIIPFWYAVGRIWNKQYLQYLFNNSIRV